MSLTYNIYNIYFLLGPTATVGKKTFKDAFDDLGSGGGYDDNEYDDFM